MTNTANINTPKSKIALALLTFLLALFASAALQSPALAETASSPSSPKDSLEAGPPKHNSAPKSGQAVKIKGAQSLGGSFTTQGTYFDTSGSPGAINFTQIVGQGYHYGNQRLSWSPTTVQRSPATSGTQVINVTHTIYKWNNSTGSWQYWIPRGYTVNVPSGYAAKAPGREYQYASSVQEHWYVEISVTWKTTGGSLIAKRTVGMTNGADYACAFSRGLCYTGGTDGQLVWLTLFT